MKNSGRCSNVRAAITKEICAEMQERGARICIGCPGPALPGCASPPSPGEAAFLSAEQAFPAGAGEPYESLAKGLAAVGYTSALASFGEEIRTLHHIALPGFFVDFTGHEDLLQAFTAAAAERGMEPSESALDLIYLFAEGLLVFKGEA